MTAVCWSKCRLLTLICFFSCVLLWLHLDFTAGLLLPFFLSVLNSPCLVWRLISDWMCVISLSFCPFSVSVTSALRQKNAVAMSSPTGHTWLHLPTPLSSPSVCLSLSGSQICHSAICILVQFLMLRLMGRTITTVLSSFSFQMVRSPCFLFFSRCSLSLSPHATVRCRLTSQL